FGNSGSFSGSRKSDRYESTSRKGYDSFSFGGGTKKPEAKPYENPYKVRSVPVARSIGSGDASSLGYAVGDKVKHERFGVGTVTAIVRGGRDFEVTVDFPSGTKKMLATFAKLQKI
ncbi:MAG: ATP-dependent DNA helicase PcrA, partial [Lachnospiraceae bacterium]|nr:ATP-dependent DNA helicase PcrA [Lachnospiraceae bacterium]